VARTWTPSAAAGSLALARSDYPHGARIAVVPATNAAADQYLQPVHRSSFEKLRRLDGAGWLQFGTWSFRTGTGASAESHETVYGYAVNIFATAASATRALKDVKIPTSTYRVARLPALRFTSSDATQTLVFVFFRYRTTEIEAYYQYIGAAPASTAATLHHYFSTQLSHLAHLARLYAGRPPAPTATPLPPTASPTNAPTPTETPGPSSTPTVVPSSTATSLPTSTSAPASTPTVTPTSTLAPTSTPVDLTVTASMGQQAYSSGEQAAVTADVTLNGQPVADITVEAAYGFSTGGESCRAVTNSSGKASCSVLVPNGNGGQTVIVNVEAVAAGGYSAQATTSFRAGP
jgi:hypothetical protein